MDYVKPVDVASAMIETGRNKLKLSPVDLVIRGALAGSILAAATSLAITGAVQTNQLLVGALIFPVGLILIVLLGLDLVTGAFGLVPLPWMERDATAPSMLANFGWIFLGNLIGSIAYGGLLAIALTNFGTLAPAGVAARIIAIAQAKTTGYEAIGFAGMVTVFVKAILCNWMVCLAIVAAMTTNSTIGKIACAYMPVFIFFAQGFEHTVVNMFIIPTGMMMGAKITVARVVAVESDSGHARQSGRRFHFHRLGDLHHAQAGQVRPRAADHADAGAGGMTTEAGSDLKLAGATATGDFEPEQKRYLEGFAAGLQIAKTAKGLAGSAGALAGRGCRPRAGAYRPRRRRVQGAGPRAQGRRQAVGPGEVQARAASVR